MGPHRAGLTFVRVLLGCLALAWLAGAGLAGCATALPAAADPAVDAELKKFSVAADKAGLYVFRTEHSLGNAPASVIQVDGTPVGLTSEMRYLYVDLPPGNHQVRTSGDSTAPLEFEARPGSLTYVWEEVPSARAQHQGTRLRRVDEAVGQAEVRRTTLASAPFAIKPFTLSPLVQTLQVRLEAEGQVTPGPLDCEAVNDLGRWAFSAPGTLTVHVSERPLQIACQAPAGFVLEPSSLPSRDPATRADNAVTGAKTGAVVGGAVGVGLAVASFPILGPMGALFVVGGAVRGAEVGGLVGAIAPERLRAYPDPIVVQLKPGPARTP